MGRESGLRGGDSVNTKTLFAFWSSLALTALSVDAQGFRDLNFEEANPVIDPEGQLYPYDVTAASALPGWTVYLGTVQPTDVLQNLFTTGEASVDIYGPNSPTTGPGFGSAGTIDGRYSVLLQAGNLPGTQTLVGGSIAQNGAVPLAAQFLEFDAWTPYAPDFSVSFAGNLLSPVALGSGPNYTTWLRRGYIPLRRANRHIGIYRPF